ncbi:hypothetical protein E4U53_000286 [Claviceps sorghi]|nr:hypothetical protein E4U53_000286 [Claviceps sorghi]
MTAGISGVSLRASPTSRSLLNRVRKSPLLTSRTVTVAGTMFQKANQAYKSAASSQHPALAKQLFPSSSPTPNTSDIRHLIRDPSSTGSMIAASSSSSAAAAAAAVSARTPPTRNKPLDDRCVNSNSTPAVSNRGHPSKISSLYSANSNSFKPEPSFVDLTGADATPNKISESVYFAEDDFSDDADLDLDFEAPSALPRQPAPAAKENLAPPSMLLPSPSQTETLIPWSSSPVSHMRPLLDQQSLSAASHVSRPALKRDSSGEVEILDAPVSKKVKKRVLPPSFRKQESLDNAHEPSHGFTPDTLSTPAQKSKALWDSSASSIKEQKKILKNQRNSSTADNGDNDNSGMAPPLEKMHDVEEKAAKAIPISLSRFERSKVMAHQKVIEFYEKLYSVADAAKARPASIAEFIFNKRGKTAVQQPQTTHSGMDDDEDGMDDDEEAMATHGY